jgi:hypothetical protein
MRKPRNHTAVIDNSGDTWVRVDEHPGQYGSWWPITDGPGWEEWGRNKVGQAREWADVREYGPFEIADGGRARRALARVVEEATR